MPTTLRTKNVGLNKEYGFSMVSKETALTLDQRAINISEFISARAQELDEFTNILKAKLSNLNKLPFQLLPKHMRRRAMSHNKYRIPSRIRQRIKEEDLLLKKPSRCRKSLRKTKLLLSSYARRSQKNRWLETHIWHAKRMRMSDYFGYKIAGRCGAKSNRAAYRYYKHDCLGYDVSYTQVLEVKSASREKLNDFLGRYVEKPSKEWSQFCNNQAIIRGGKKGFISLWNSNPKKLIQRCEYIYRPRVNEESEYQVWFFLHPTTKDNLKQIAKDSEGVEGIKCKLFEDSFNLFHLIGPDSCNKINWLLRNIANSSGELEALVENNIILKTMKTINDPGAYPKNFVVHISLEKRNEAKLIHLPRRIFDRQEESSIDNQDQFNELMVNLATYDYVPTEASKTLELWDALESPPNDEYSIRFKNITRGRFTHRKKNKQEENKFQPKKKNSNKPPKAKKTGLIHVEPAGPEPQKQNESVVVESQVIEEKKSAEEVQPSLNHMEEEKPSATNTDKRIEIILMQDAGESQTSQGAGIQILVPCGKGLYVWRLLNYLGCKALGLAEYHHVLNERRDFVYPQDFPYSSGYELYQAASKEEKMTKYFQKPPAKRINLIKIGSPYAFASDWQAILSPYIENMPPQASLRDYLVPVYVKMIRRRYPVDLAMICVPTEEDLVKIKEYETRREAGDDIMHTEPLHKADFAGPLKKVTQAEYVERMKSIKVSRTVSGFITTGHYSYRFGCGYGKGYIARPLLEQLKYCEVPSKAGNRDSFESGLNLSNNSNSERTVLYMLIRNPSSRYYYACKAYCAVEY